jgi:hypothetical protein
MKMNVLARLALATSFALAAACGGSTGTVDDPTAAPPAETPASAAGPRVTLALRGTTTPVAHADAFASQTPASQKVAVNGLWLLKSADDPSPLTVADLGDDAVETDLVSGTTNEIATVALKSLPAGTYTIAKVGVAWVRYRVAARLHPTAGGGAGDVAPAERYDNVQALSDGAVVDGQPRKKGWFRSELGAGDTTYGAYEGTDAPLPQLPSSGGMTLETSGPRSFYVFRMHVTIDPDAPDDQRIVCEVNVHESFRWQDQAQAGYAAKVFDTTPTTFEPVMSFGASAFSLFLEPAK